MLDKNETVDKTAVTIPVIISSVVGQTVNTEIIPENKNEYIYKYNIENYDERKTSAELLLSRTFSLEEFSYQADISILSTRNLSNAILHNNFLIKHYEDLKPSVTKEALVETNNEYFSYLMKNQDVTGGFGWFDYDAVSLESSVSAARAYKSSNENNLKSNTYVQNKLASYFNSVMESEKSSVYDIILAYDGLTLVNPEQARMYIYQIKDLYKKSDDAVDSALVTAYLMDSYNNIGNYGMSKELVSKLSELAQKETQMIYWNDVESKYREKQSPVYVTSMVYFAMSPLEEWNMKYLIRNWLIREVSTSNLNNAIYREVIYYIATGDEDSIYFIQNPTDIEVYVNGKQLSNFRIEEGDIYMRKKISITSDFLKEGENEIKIVKTGQAEIYSILKMNNAEELSTKETTDFAISRKFFDLDTGKELNLKSIPQNTMVKVVISVKTKENRTDVIVKDYIPTGFEQVNLDYNGVSMLVINKFYAYSEANKWGSMARDYVTFVEPEMKKDKEYKFEYLAVAGVKGDVNGGGTSVFLNLRPDVNGFIQSDRVVVK